MDNLQQLREALEQQRKYERENWPFVGENNEPTGTGASITYHLASLYCWSPGYVLTLPPEERDQRLQEIWRDFSIAGDIIKRYEEAAEALFQEEQISKQEFTTMHAAIALSPGNKARLTFHEKSILVVQELDQLIFRWWVVEEDGHVWENQKECEVFMQHLENQDIDPQAKIWMPL